MCIRDRKAIVAEIGPKAMASVYMAEGDYMHGYMSADLRPEGTLGKVTLTVRFADWSEIIPGLRAAWAEHRELHASNATKGMALAIIRLTAENGECTDSALRCEFVQQEIDCYGDAAAALATEMGGNGPFEIVRLGVGNMPEAA